MGEGPGATVAVIGASRGLGLAFVRAYAVDGARVHACCRDPRQAPELSRAAGAVQVHRLDVTKPQEIAAAAQAAAVSEEPPTPGKA